MASVKGKRNTSVKQGLGNWEHGFVTQPYVQQCRGKLTVGRLPESGSERSRRPDNISASLGQHFREIERDDGLVLYDENSRSSKRTVPHLGNPLLPNAHVPEEVPLSSVS